MKRKILTILVCVIALCIFTQCKKKTDFDKVKPNLKIESAFYFSSDSGKTYGNRTKEFTAGESVYMQIKTKVQDSKQDGYKPSKKPIIIGAVAGFIIGAVLGIFLGIVGFIPGSIVGALFGVFIGVYILPASTPSEIRAELHIPNIKSVDSKLYDGKPIKPVIDNERNIVIYDLVIPVSKGNDVEETEFTFQFLPKEPIEITMSLVFDEALSQYNTQNTIKFVK